MGKLAYFSLAPAGASARQKIEHTFDMRGRYPITGFRVSTKFPAGFFKKWRTIDESGEILVYLKPQPLDDFYHALPMLAGRIESQARGSGDDLYAIRRYHPSDHMRHIDWKATAKSLEMMVREHMREDEWRLTIVFDTAAPPDSAPIPMDQAGPDGTGDEADVDTRAADQGVDARFERAIVMAASLANHFILERADVELITPSAEPDVPPGSGYDHLYRILRSLAVLQPTPAEVESQPEKERKRRWSLDRFRRARSAVAVENDEGPVGAAGAIRGTAWRLLDEMPVLADERRFKVLITSARKGSIPGHVWRSAHVVFMEDL